MTAFATCAGQRVVGGSLVIPLVGAWTADLYLATDTPITGAAEVVIGNLTLEGAVFRSDVYGGQTRARLVGGAGGWRKDIPAQGYGGSGGVLLSHVVQDAAMLVGERVNVVADGSIGNAFVRLDGLASEVLWQLVHQGTIPAWRITPDGVTQLSPWPIVTVVTPFTVTEQRPEEGYVEIATEDYAAWMPGAQFTAPQLARTYTSGGVVYRFTDDGTFRFEVLTLDSGGSDRVLGPLASFVARQLASTRFFGRYSYTISSPTSSTIDGTPRDQSLGLPDLQNVPLRSDSIASYTPPDGGEAHVQFVNGDPRQPVCVWTEGAPTAAQILEGAHPVARLGDQVQSFLPPSLPVVGTVGGSPFAGTITIPNPITGAITGGSAQVETA